MSTEAIKELRAITGISIAECNKALKATNFDLEKAQDWLREQSSAKIEKKKDRSTSEGVSIAVISDDNKSGGILICRCETDFVAKSDDFISATTKLANTLLAENVVENSHYAIDTFVQDASLLFSENLAVEWTGLPGDTTTLYHYAYNHGNRISVLLAVDTQEPDLAKSVAMHIASENPLAKNLDDLVSTVEYQKEEEFVGKDVDDKMADKPKEMREKIKKGKLHKFIKQNCLMEQPLIMDTDKTVAEYLGDKINELTFIRTSI